MNKKDYLQPKVVPIIPPKNGAHISTIGFKEPNIPINFTLYTGSYTTSLIITSGIPEELHPIP